jgi:hypothetical protein
MAKTLDELNKLYTEAEEVDKELFAEQRSNLLLVAGEHYAKVNKAVASNIRTSGSKSGATEQKLRLTKNHMHKVHRSYKTAILAEAPSTTIGPKNATEMQDQKDAEMNQSVWQDIRHRHHFESRTDTWADQFVGIGEVCVKVFWDPMAGEFLGYEQKVDEAGEPVLEEMTDELTGEPVMEEVQDEFGNIFVQPAMGPTIDEEKPLFKGDFVFEDVYGFNLMREAGTTNMEEKDRAWVVRKMVDTEELKRRCTDDEIQKKILETATQTFVVFDAGKNGYEKRQGQTLVKEYYWDKCTEFPEGWYVYATENVILEEGPLPGGVFPLVWEGFDKHPSTPRGRSIIKVARPWQAEINRASSQMAVAQITLGDDKILYQSGTKLAQGALLPGVRGVAYQGKEPTVLPGRTGAQYLEYVQANVAEMYSALMIDENDNLDKSGAVDPFAVLFRAASRKRRYSPYATKFERWQVRLTEKTLEIAKLWMPDDMLVYATGRREQVNIPEFRKTSKLCYQIKVEPRSDQLETQFGKQLTFQHLIQYVGKQMDPKTIGKMAKQLPFGNYEEAFDDLTIDDDIAKNDMLALERGEQVEATEHLDPSFMLKKLEGRMKKPDFKVLRPEIQAGYKQLKFQYTEMQAQLQAKLAAAKNEFIPVDGALVTVDVYVPDPKNPQNQAKRLKRLEEQGANQEQLEGMQAHTLSQLADVVMAQRGEGQQLPGQNPQRPLPPRMAG